MQLLLLFSSSVQFSWFSVLFDVVDDSLTYNKRQYHLIYYSTKENRLWTWSHFNNELRGNTYVNFKEFLNPFFLSAPFLYPLKTSQNPKVFWCFLGVEKGSTGNKWVNPEFKSWAINVSLKHVNMIYCSHYVFLEGFQNWRSRFKGTPWTKKFQLKPQNFQLNCLKQVRVSQNIQFSRKATRFE